MEDMEMAMGEGSAGPGQLVVIDRDDMVLRPVMTVGVAMERLAEFQQFVASYLHQSSDGGTDGGDYGIIPGAGNTKVLFKSGADKLCDVYGIYDTYVITSKVEEWDTGLFDYVITCELRRRKDDMMVGTGMGSCSSYESKYRWRKGQRKCPRCDSDALRKSKEPNGGFYCWAKIGGCGATFVENDPQIIGQSLDRVENPDIADMKNTVLKMAQKRAKIAAVISVTRSSGIFTQDMEDLQPVQAAVVVSVTPTPSTTMSVPGPNIGPTASIVPPEKISKPVNVAHTPTIVAPKRTNVAHMAHMDPELADNMAEPTFVPPAGPQGDAVSVKMQAPRKGPDKNGKPEWVLYPCAFEPKVRATDGKMIGSATTFSDSDATKLMDAEQAGRKVVVVVEPNKKKPGMYNIVSVDTPAT
jgi:hypothetical protein